jgi:hypothetical protein
VDTLKKMVMKNIISQVSWKRLANYCFVVSNEKYGKRSVDQERHLSEVNCILEDADESAKTSSMKIA